MIPFALGLGLLAANAFGNDYVAEKQRGKLAEGMKGLLGSAEGARAGDEGPVQIPGTGLLADPTNIENQMKFAQGLMALPGGGKALQSFAPMLQQAIQSKQWQQGQQQLAGQFDRTEGRLGQQHADSMDWQRQESERLQSNWTKQYEQTAAQQAQQLHMEGARLSLAQQSAAREAKESAWRMAGGAGGGGEKIPSGYGVVDTASGKSLAPIKGTKDYATAVNAEGTLSNTIGTIDALMDEYLGKETTTPGGNVKREGGYGSEWDIPFSNKAPLTSMNNKRGSIIAALGSAREMGVLDKNEYERLTKQLPEVNDLRSKPEAFEAAYKGIRSEFQRKLETHRKANPWLVPPPPPGYH